MEIGWEDQLERYANYLRAKGSKSRFVATTRTYLRHLGKSFDKPYLDITREELETWFADLRERGITGKKGLADASLHSTLGRIRSCLRFLNHGMTPDSIRGLSYGKNRKRVRGNDELFTEDEIKELGNALEQHWKTVFLTLAHTGARPSEVLSLKVGDIKDPQTVDGTTFVLIYFRETKTDKPREVTVFDPQALQAIEEFLGLLAPKDGYLFPARNGKPCNPNTYREALQRTARRLGWTKRVYPYLTRHSYVTRLRELGFSDSDIMVNCGFEDARMLQNYGHPNPDALRKRMAKKLAPTPVKEVPTQAEIDGIVEELVAAALKDQSKDIERMVKEQVVGIINAMQSRGEVDFNLYQAYTKREGETDEELEARAKEDMIKRFREDQKKLA